jgi:hypothetical protein
MLCALTACKIETDHTIRVKDETGKTDKGIDIDVDITVGSGYKPINTLAKIEPAVESDTAFFSNQEKIKNWSWNWYEDPLYSCASSTLANMPFGNPHWYFAVGCQFTSFSCNEIGWYEQVHNDFFLVEITNVGGHIDPKNCLGAGTHLCEFKVKKGKNDAGAFDYHCEKTDEELSL